MLRDVVALVDGEVNPFELGVACEVFGLRRDDVPELDFAVCAATPGPVPALGGTTVVVHHGLDRVASADLVVLPSWRVEGGAPTAGVAQALHDVVDRGGTLLALCTGAFLAAAVGLLDGRRATCHWADAARLAELHPAVRVEPDRLYVSDGPVVTSAGTAAGIDAALHVVRRDLGAAAATAIARHMVVPPHREGGQAQYVTTPVAVPDADDLAPLLAWIVEHLDRRLTVADLAARAHTSSRTFVRRFEAATGSTPGAWIAAQRLLLAQRLLETAPTLGVEQVARRCGFSSADLLRHHFAARLGTSPSAYRRAWCSAGEHSVG